MVLMIVKSYCHFNQSNTGQINGGEVKTDFPISKSGAATLYEPGFWWK
jgi:hypothetical protein